MKRPLVLAALAQLLAVQALRAQDAFYYRLVDTNWDQMFCRSMVPIGAGTYRLCLTMQDHVMGVDLHEDGSVSNAYEVATDTNYSANVNMVLPTSDGGHLISYFEVADNTDKWTFLKADAAGVVEWVRHFPDNYGLVYDTYGNVVEKDGHYFVITHTQDVPGTEGWASVLLELDGTGALVAQRRFAGGDPWSESTHGLIHNRANGLTHVSVLRPYFSQASFPQIVVQKWNADLDLDWSRQYSFGNYHLLTSVNELADGGLVLTGSVRLGNSGSFLPFIFKVDTLGEVVWSRRNSGTIPLLQDVVEDSNGSFVAVGYTAQSERVIARLDSAGALTEAWLTSGGTSLPTELLRDTATNELLVRYLGYPMVMRLDSNLLIDCEQDAFSWSDDLIAPTVEDHPVVLSPADTLENYPITATSQPFACTTFDPCLSTAVAPEERDPHAEIWPVPTSGPLYIRLPGATERLADCTIVDTAGRHLQHSRVPVSNGMVQLDIGTLTSGPYAIVIRCGARIARSMVLKN